MLTFSIGKAGDLEALNCLVLQNLIRGTKFHLSMNRQFLVGAVICWRSFVRYVFCLCQLKYVIRNIVLKYVQSNENIMCT